MAKVYLHELKSKKQLRKINCKPVISAGFADDQEKEYTITFDCGENGKMVDLSIFFGSSQPKIYVSDEYS